MESQKPHDRSSRCGAVVNESLAWEPPYAAEAALEETKKKKKKNDHLNWHNPTTIHDNNSYQSGHGGGIP